MQHLDDGRLQEWVDRARSGLGAHEQDAIQRHLAECGDCAGRVAHLAELDRHTRALLSSGMPTYEPPDFAGVSRRAHGLADGHRRRRLMRGGGWAASVAIALGVGWAANEMARGGPLANGDRPTPSSTPRAETPVRPASPLAADRSAEAPPADERSGGERAIPRRAEPIGAQEPAVVADATATPPSIGPATRVDPIELLDIAVPAPTEPRLPVALGPESAGVEVTPITRSGPRVVRGRVTDVSGSPVEAAQVFVEGTPIGALTNTDGEFRLLLGDAASAAEAQPLTLMVQRIGYSQVSRDLTGVRGDTTLVDVRLSEQALSLDQIVVTGTAAGERTQARRGAVEGDIGAVRPVTVGAARWAPLQRADVEAAAGFAIMSLPGRPIAEVAVESFEGVWVTRVVQTLAGGETVVLFQSRRAIRVADDLVEDRQVTASTTRDGFFVVALGGLPVESLEAVLERVR